MYSTHKNRLNWIDATKGFAMLLVIWGHVQDTSPLYLFVTAFHVPLFLVISGILFEINGRVGGGKTLFLKLIKPYLTFSVIAIFAYLFRDILMEADYHNNLLLNIYKTFTGYGINALWFIPSYFIACTVYRFVFSKSERVFFILMLFFMLSGVGGSEFIRFLNNYSKLSIYLYYPFVGLVRGFTCTFYICIGSLLWRILVTLTRIRDNVLFIFVIMLLSLVGSYFSSQMLSDANFSLLRLGSNPMMNYVSGMLGAVGFAMMFYLIRSLKFRFLEYIGRNSLTIMGTHMSMLFTTIATALMIRLWYIEPQPSLIYYLWGFGCVLIVILLEIPTIWLFNTKLKSLVDKI